MQRANTNVNNNKLLPQCLKTTGSQGPLKNRFQSMGNKL